MTEKTMTERDLYLAAFEREYQTTLKVLRAYPREKSELKPADKLKAARELAWMLVLNQMVVVPTLSGKLVPGSVCGKLSLYVKPNGEITPCGFIPVPIGNILRDDFGKVWRESKLLGHLRNKAAAGKCSGCAKFSSCLGGCTARAYAVYGAWDAPDPHCWAPDRR